MMIRLSGAAALAVAALAVAGCSAGSTSSSPGAAVASTPAAAPSTPAPAPSTSASAPPVSSDDCLLGANGADVEVGIDDSSQSCGQWIQNLAGTGLAWNTLAALAVPGSQGDDGDTYAQTCDLTDGNGAELYVQDGGSMSDGNSICSQEEQNGWTPEGSPGPIASAEAQDEEAGAEVSASESAASASAEESSQVASDDAALQADTAQAGTDYGTWADDVKTAKAALQKVQGEPKCSGGTTDQQTYSDAADVYSDGATVYSDESSLTTDANRLQSDIADLSGTSDYSADLSAARAALSKAQSAVNEDESSKIQSAAEDVQTATDSCT